MDASDVKGIVAIVKEYKNRNCKKSKGVQIFVHDKGPKEPWTPSFIDKMSIRSTLPFWNPSNPWNCSSENHPDRFFHRSTDRCGWIFPSVDIARGDAYFLEDPGSIFSFHEQSAFDLRFCLRTNIDSDVRMDISAMRAASSKDGCNGKPSKRADRGSKRRCEIVFSYTSQGEKQVRIRQIIEENGKDDDELSGPPAGYSFRAP